MSDEHELPTDGGSLRTMLQEKIGENNRLQQELHGMRASTLIQEHGFTLVSAEDASNIAAEDLETSLRSLQEERVVGQADTVRSVLAQQGLEGDALEQAVSNVFNGEVPAVAGVTSASAEASGRQRDLSSIPGKPPGAVSTLDLHGRDAIVAGLSK